MLVETPPSISIYDGTQTSVVIDNGSMPSWAPDGRVIFVSDRGTGKQIWITDGSVVTQIGVMPSGVEPAFPQMGRNGLVVFSAMGPDDQPDSNQHIFVMNSEGSAGRELTQGRAPSMAASGTWVAYTYQTDNPYHRYIYRINIDGTGLLPLTNTNDPDYPEAVSPSISPDETAIAIFSGKAADRNSQSQSMFTFGHRDIAVIPAWGGPRRRITNCQPVTTQAELEAVTTQCIVADDAAWTPDGQALIFNAMFKWGTQVWMADLNGSNFSGFYYGLRGNVRVPLR
jgi:Tol biopolymer transport system component